jgi:hypothetical protein
MPSRFALIPALLWLVSGCAILRGRLPQEPYQPRPLAAPAGPAVTATQEVSGEWNGRTRTLLCALELDETHLAVAGLATTGLNLFTLEYDGETLSVHKSELIPQELDPRAVVADLQLAFWPAPALRDALGDDWQLQVTSRNRRLYRGGRLAVLVSYGDSDPWAGTVRLQDLQLGYQITVKTLNKE